MTAKNTTPEIFDEAAEEELTQEEILMNESDLLAGLLDLGKEKDNAKNHRTIRIRRNEGVKLVFRVRPITEDESRACMKRATPTSRNKKANVETDWVKYRSLLIYTATVDEDRAKIWDNKEAIRKMNLMEGWEIIDQVMYAGEKTRILEIIDEISGYGDDLEEAAKD